MNITVQATNIALTDAISRYVDKRVSGLNKYLDRAVRTAAVARVEVGKSTNHHRTGDVFRAEVHLTGPSLDVYAAAESADLYAAIDIVRNEVARELSKTKGRRLVLLRRSGRAMKNAVRGLPWLRDERP